MNLRALAVATGFLCAGFVCSSPREGELGEPCGGEGDCVAGLHCQAVLEQAFCTAACTVQGKTDECPTWTEGETQHAAVCDGLTGLDGLLCARICLSENDCFIGQACVVVEGTTTMACKPQ